MANGIYYLYLIIVIPLALLLATKADHRPLVAVFLLWLLGSPALLQKDVMLRIAPLNFDLQPTRILLLILLPALVMNRLAPEIVRKRSFVHLASFEKALVAYVVISILAMVVNIDNLGSPSVMRGAEAQLTFGLLYFSGRDYLTPGDYKVLERGIVLLAIFSALVATLQFIYDPYFFRVSGTFRNAFGDVGRSTGAFGQEYEQTMYATFAAIVIGLRDRSRLFWRWIFLALLLGVSVLVSFQRMPWAVFIFAVVCVLIIRNWNNTLWRNLGIVATGIILVLVVFVPWPELISSYLPRKLVTDRLMSEAFSARLEFNALAISLLPKYPIGLGETSNSPIYNREYRGFGLSMFNDAGNAYTIHNGFLSAAVRFGLAGGLAFGGMLFGCLIFSARRVVASKPETFILPLIAAVIIFYNMTEDFGAAGGQATFAGVWLMGCIAGRSLYQLDFSEKARKRGEST